jgi:hypothetical protein
MNLDQWFLLLAFICVSGIIATAGFFLMIAFVAVTEGKDAAIETFKREW